LTSSKIALIYLGTHVPNLVQSSKTLWALEIIDCSDFDAITAI